jgi:hypothetical protein
MTKLLSAYQDLSTALREDGQGSPYSSKRIGFAALVSALIVSGFMILSVVGKIAITGTAFSPWLTIALLGVPSLFLVGAIVFAFFSTKKDIDDTIKIAADIIKNKAAE